MYERYVTLGFGIINKLLITVTVTWSIFAFVYPHGWRLCLITCMRHMHLSVFYTMTTVGLPHFNLTVV